MTPSNGQEEMFIGPWWSARLPPGWGSQVEAAGVSFSKTPKFGTLQISSSRKDSGHVTDEDLRDFASEIGIVDLMEHVRVGVFAGFLHASEREGYSWHEWWLASGSLLVYASYVTPHTSASRPSELLDVNFILNSLAAR